MGPLTSRRALTVALCGGYFLVLLDVTVVNVALPSIGTGLHASSAGKAWIVDAYTVPLAALLLAAGAIGDVLGHRRVVLAGFTGFGLASIVCASAPNLPALAAGRAGQGVCAALMLPGTLALLTDSAPSDEARTRVVGVWAAVGGCALPAGPFVGGIVVQDLGWRWVFWLNVPVIVAALGPVARTARSRRTASRRIDWAGATALVVVIGAAVTAIIEGPDHVGLGAVSGGLAVAAGAAFAVIERRTEHRLLPVPAPARRPLAAGCAVAAMMNLSALGSLFLITQVLQDVHGKRPMETGLLLLPAMVPLPLLGSPSGRLAHRIGAWRTSALGLGVGAVGFALMAVAIRRPDYPLLLVGFGCWGAGLGILTPAIVAVAIRALPSAQGLASGASNTARQVGAALGVATFGTLAGPADHAGFAGHAAGLFAGCAVAFALVAVLAARRRSAAGRSAATHGRSEPAGAPEQPVHQPAQRHHHAER